MNILGAGKYKQHAGAQPTLRQTAKALHCEPKQPGTTNTKAVSKIKNV